MKTIEYEAIEILRRGEPLPADMYIELNNSGIDPEYLINNFKEEEPREEEKDDGLDPIQREILREFSDYLP
mgnify:FL=1